MPTERDPKKDPRPGDRTVEGGFYRNVISITDNTVSYRFSMSQSAEHGKVRCITKDEWRDRNESATVLHVAQVAP